MATDMMRDLALMVGHYSACFKMVESIALYAADMPYDVREMAYNANIAQLQNLLALPTSETISDLEFFRNRCMFHAIDWLTYIDPEKATQEIDKLTRIRHAD
jgi:hypothetical protein